jgi:hypothetical protein
VKSLQLFQLLRCAAAHADVGIWCCGKIGLLVPRCYGLRIHFRSGEESANALDEIRDVSSCRCYVEYAADVGVNRVTPN